MQYSLRCSYISYHFKRAQALFFIPQITERSNLIVFNYVCIYKYNQFKYNKSNSEWEYII